FSDAACPAIVTEVLPGHVARRRLMASAPLNEGSTGPTLLKRGPEMRHNTYVLEFPYPVVADILVVIRRRAPYCLVAIAVGAGLQEVPGTGRCIAIDRNNGTEDIVDSERDALTRTAKELANSLSPLTATEYPTIPDRISSEQRGQGIGIIVGIAIGSVT